MSVGMRLPEREPRNKKKNLDTSVVVSNSADENLEILLAIDKLKEPFEEDAADEYILLWQQTFEERRKLINHSTTPSEIFETYPPLKTNLGISMVSN